MDNEPWSQIYNLYPNIASTRIWNVGEWRQLFKWNTKLYLNEMEIDDIECRSVWAQYHSCSCSESVWINVSSCLRYFTTVPFVLIFPMTWWFRCFDSMVGHTNGICWLPQFRWSGNQRFETGGLLGYLWWPSNSSLRRFWRRRDHYPFSFATRFWNFLVRKCMHWLWR